MILPVLLINLDILQTYHISRIQPCAIFNGCLKEETSSVVVVAADKHISGILKGKRKKNKSVKL